MKTHLGAKALGRRAPLWGAARPGSFAESSAGWVERMLSWSDTAFWLLISKTWPFYGLVFLIGTENFIVSPFLPDMARSVGVSVEALATVVTAYALTYAIAAPLLGQVTDRVGTRWLIAVGITVFAVGNGLVAVAPTLGGLQWARALTGLGGAAAGPAIWSHIAGTTPPGLRGRAMGLGMGAFALGQVAGLPLGGLVASVAGWRWVFGGIGLLMLPLLASSMAHDTGRAGPLHSPHGSRMPLFAVWCRPALVCAFLVTFLFQMGNLGSYTFLGAMLRARYGLTSSQLGAIGILIGGGSLAGSFAGGQLNDWWRKRSGKSSHLAAGWALLLALSVFVATSGPPLAIGLLAVALWFVASGAFVTTQMTLITLAAPALRATALSWNNSLLFAGAGAGVLLIGTGLHHGLPVGALGLGSGLAAAAAALYFSKTECRTNEEQPS